MGKRVPHIAEDRATGRLFYRRVFPEPLRPFLEKIRRELKVPLGANGRLSASAMRQWEMANRQFEKDVRAAKAAKTLQAKTDADRFDVISPELISHLVGDWKAQDLELDADVRWAARPREAKVRAYERLGENVKADLAEALRLRAMGDLDGIVATWGEPASDFAAHAGLRLDRTSPEFREYVRAIHDAQIEAWEIILRRLQGENVPTPSVPPAPTTRRGPEPITKADGTASFHDIVETLLESPRKSVSATTKESVRTALRLFREVHGTPTPAEITRAMVADWLDMLAQRPAKLSAEHRGTPLPELVELYRGRQDIARLTPKTLAQHLGSLGARWTEAGKSGRLEREAPNPFKDHDLGKAKRPKAPKGFSDDELKAIFGLPVFTSRYRPRGGKGEASYWLPLLLLFTGARPEEIAQLLVADVFQDAKSSRWMLRITDEGEHPHKGQQRLKTPESRRTFPVPQTLIDLGLPRYLEHLKSTGETALFPQLRTKGARGLLYAGFGDWWGKYLREHEVHLEGTGRQPMRETRHTWSTAARACGVPREAMAYIQGHALKDATSGEDYGDRNPLGFAIDRVGFEGLDLSQVRGWRPGG